MARQMLQTDPPKTPPETSTGTVAKTASCFPYIAGFARHQWGRALSSAETRRRHSPGKREAMLQWGRALSSAETFTAGRRPAGVSTLQWGRALSSAETGGQCPQKMPPENPSMGPRSFERGDSAYRRSLCAASSAFNGAALFRARRPGENVSQKTRFSSSFNGAALFRARRRIEDNAGVMGLIASMGPRSFERGDDRDGGPGWNGILRLQWGRALSSAETRVPTRARQAGPRFNGAALFRARRLGYRPGAPHRFRSFNGAALFRARRQARILDKVVASCSPSMGPRSFERGDYSVLCTFGRIFSRPSMGPRSFERGDLERATPWHTRFSPFNGAALFRARRLST